MTNIHVTPHFLLVDVCARFSVKWWTVTSRINVMHRKFHPIRIDDQVLPHAAGIPPVHGRRPSLEEERGCLSREKERRLYGNERTVPMVDGGAAACQGSTFYASVEEYVEARGGNRPIKKVRYLLYAAR